jgi:cytoskeletal protein RodZ
MMPKDTQPGHPRAFGEELRRLRSSSGLSLDDIAAETKISLRVLEGLELGRFQFLPEQVFSRNFVRQYARTVGVDEERLVVAFDEAWDRFQLSSGTHPALMVTEAPPRAPIRWRFWIPIAAGVLILFAVAFVILGGSEPQTELMPDPRRSTRVPFGGDLDSPGVPVVPTSVTPGGANQEEIDLISLTVRVEEEKECWIQYRDREGMTGHHLLKGGQELTLDLAGPVKFTVGNADAVTIIVGDIEYSDLGVAGQVVHTELSRDGLVPLGAGAWDD